MGVKMIFFKNFQGSPLQIETISAFIFIYNFSQECQDSLTKHCKRCPLAKNFITSNDNQYSYGFSVYSFF